MVSYGGTEGTRGQSFSKRSPWTDLTAKSFYEIFAPMLKGDFNAPFAKMMKMTAKEEAQKGVEQERTKIAQATDLSPVATQKMFRDVGSAAVAAGPGALQNVFKSVGDYLSQLLSIPVETVSVQKGGRSTQGGVCSCENLKALNEGYLMASLRTFRDLHFRPLSDIDIGYKWMAEWFVPLVLHSKFIKKMGRMVMFHPLTQLSTWVYRGNKHGFIFIPFMYFWIYFWKMAGRVTSQRFVEKTPRSNLSRYPLMITTFGRRFKEVMF